MSVDEAIGLYHDPKPLPRVRDPEVFKRFHETETECLACGHGRPQAHHLLSRAQGGDDVIANLIPLDSLCHGALHGTPTRAFGVRIDKGFVESAISRYLMSEAGSDALSYLRSKRSDGWISAKFGVDL